MPRECADALANRHCWLKRLDWLSRRPQPPGELGHWLRESNVRLGCGDRTLTAIQRLAQGAPAVVTGQQAGLLTGPLYTIYKAVSAIAWARYLAAELDTPVVPVFWLASEDHDFAEVRSAALPGQDKLELVTFPGEFSLTPAAQIPLAPADVAQVLARLEELLPRTEFTPALMELVAAAAGAGSFACWCGSILSRLFARYGLVICDSWGKPVRTISRPIFAGALAQGEEIHRLIRQKGDGLRHKGVEPALDIPRQHSHLFYLNGNKRLALLRKGDSFVDRHNQISFTQAQLEQIIAQQPWHLSPNVVLRPLVQEMVLPVLAMVVGPGERAYMAQMEEVFGLFDLQAPPLLHRMGGIMVEPALARLLEKYQLSPQQVGAGMEHWLQGQLENSAPVDISAVFARLRDKLTAEYRLLGARLVQVEQGLADLAEKNLDRVLQQVDWLEHKALAAHKGRHSQLLAHARRLEMALAPRGGQERVHNFLWYYNKYGPDLLERLLDQPQRPDMTIWL